VHEKQRKQNNGIHVPNKMHKKKPKTNVAVNCKNCLYVCAYHCEQLSYTTQHGTAWITPCKHHSSDAVTGRQQY